MVDGRAVAPVELAGSYLRRLRGMLLRRELPPALLLYPGAGVHGIGMSRSLDVAQLAPLDGVGRCRSIEQPHVVRHVARLRPFGMVGSRRGVCSVLEAPAGSFDGWALRPDSVVGLEPRPQP